MRFLSGIQPSGNITLGNYIGAIKNFVKLQDNPDFTDFLVFVADMHAITVPQDKQALRKNIKSLVAIYLACGLNPEKVHIFIQSEVPAHATLGWILQCTGYIGELERMTQFKDKKEKQTQGVSVGLLTYPSLMAADILLYDTDLVPIGKDQKQHLELTRDLADRFNTRYGETFVVPEPFVPEAGAKIMSLVDPTKKMSKSTDNPKGVITLLDDLEVARKKIMGATTDSETVVRFDSENKPGISNLINIYVSLTGKSIEETEKEFEGCNYGTFKTKVADVVVELLKNIQEKYNKIISSNELDKILDDGMNKTTQIAKLKFEEVKKKMGFKRY